MRSGVRSVALLALITGLAVSACSGAEPDVDTSGSSSTSAASDPSSAADPPTTVPAPNASETGEVPAPDALVTAEPVPLDATADFGSGVVARLADLSAVDVVAQGPGEISGPGLAVTVELTNGTTEALDLSTVTVSLDASGQEAAGIDSAPAAPVSGQLAPGASTTGVYVFAVAPELRSAATVSVGYTASLPILLFQGDATG